MSVPAAFTDLVGQWEGENRLWLSSDDPAQLSHTSATLELVAQGKFLSLRYTWSYENTPQDGLLVLGAEPDAGVVEAVWIDSWHMQDRLLQCVGDIGGHGALSVTGSYAAPPGPDWGWRIELTPAEPDSWRLCMYNIWPEGRTDLAVEANYSRMS